MTTDKEKNNKSDEVEGHLVRRLAWAPLRVLAVVTGFAVIRGILALVARFLLVFRRRAKVSVEDGTLVLDEEWSIFGKSIRKARTVSKISDVDAVRFENRKRYLHLLVGFGFLAVGVWFGIQWLVDGLRAGYPLLATVGAGIVLVGILLDVVVYLWVPEGKGKSRLYISLGSWRVRVAGVERRSGEKLVEEVRGQWGDRSGAR